MYVTVLWAPWVSGGPACCVGPLPGIVVGTTGCVSLVCLSGPQNREKRGGVFGEFVNSRGYGMRAAAWHTRGSQRTSWIDRVTE